ncbi:MAG: TIGR03790 family protein [Syntrophales bacterium]
MDLAGYRVYRKGPADNEFRQVAQVPKIARIDVGKESDKEKKDPYFALTPPLYVDTDVQNGNRYEYRVRAYDLRGNAGEYTKVAALRPAPWSLHEPGEALILANSDVRESMDVAEYYAAKRNIPRKNILGLPLGKDIYEFRKFDYARDLQTPLKRFLLEKNLAGKIRYIVPCFGVPIRGAGRAIDSKLADPFDRYIWGPFMGTPNPYFNSGKHFDATYGVFLVTRIDGPTAEMAKGLVDKALRAGKSVKAASGRAYLATKENWGNDPLVATRKTAASLGIPVTYREGVFEEGELPDDALWYFAWRHPYKDPKKGEWPVGAVGAHLISDSFYQMRDNYGGKYKSWVQGMVEKGITGTFGAVIEPYYKGYTRPDIFFGHFWTGEYDFAESFFMATPTVQWAMSAVGDPLYRLAPR